MSFLFVFQSQEKARKIEKPQDKLVVNPSSSSHRQDDSEVREKTPHAVQNSADVLGNKSPAQQQHLQDQQSTTPGDMSEYMSIIL